MVAVDMRARHHRLFLPHEFSAGESRTDRLYPSYGGTVSPVPEQGGFGDAP
jgi:hypothetical protein